MPPALPVHKLGRLFCDNQPDDYQRISGNLDWSLLA